MANYTDAELRLAVCRPSDDPVKRDLELICKECGEHVCDVEANDNLDILADCFTDHRLTCPGEPDEAEVSGR